VKIYRDIAGTDLIQVMDDSQSYSNGASVWIRSYKMNGYYTPTVDCYMKCFTNYNDLSNKPVTFFEIGGGNPPDNIKDNMYHMGKISLGTNTIYQRYNLYIKNTDSGAIANDIVFSNRFGNLIENILTSNSNLPSKVLLSSSINANEISS